MSGGRLEPPAVQLSTTLFTFSATDPGSWNHLFERARVLDEGGLDRLVVSDHVVFGENLEAYAKPEVGGVAGGKQPTGPDGHWLEPLTTLSVLAGMTTRIRLGTNILIAALRRPVVKTTSTLDVLSGGRLDLGVGVGWQREEYEAAGLDFAGRGRLLDHSLEVCRTLWNEQRAHHSSPELSFDGIHMMPKPLRPNGVPIWIGGTINPRVVRRLARFGAGWIPWGANAAIFRPASSADAGRDPVDLQVVGSLPTIVSDSGTMDIDRTMDAVPDLVAAGVTDVRTSLRLPSDPSEATDRVRQIVAAFRDATGRSA
jgi:probable F420-dependent oxidoreductase